MSYLWCSKSDLWCSMVRISQGVLRCELFVVLSGENRSGYIKVGVIHCAVRVICGVVH